jgi:hypothetical protein
MSIQKNARALASRYPFIALALALPLGACGGEGGQGSVIVAASGEEAAEVGYPTSTGPDAIAFADGFTLTFSKVVVSLGHLRLDAADGDSANVDTEPVIVDLTLGRTALWELEGVPSRRWDRVSYARLPAMSGARNVNAAPADVDEMIASGASLLVAGTATDGTSAYDFSFAFTRTVENGACTNGMDETDGIIVSENATTEAEITIHLDHLFFDSFATDEPSLRFEPMAAMADEGGAITLDALAGQELAALVDRDGMPLEDEAGGPIVYDPGPLALPTDDLAAYVRAAAVTTGHFNGEGHCEYRVSGE